MNFSNEYFLSFADLIKNEKLQEHLKRQKQHNRSTKGVIDFWTSRIGSILGVINLILTPAN